jgi:hypothetical protein
MSVQGTTLYVGTDNGIFKSNDYGDSWTNISSGITNLNVDALAINGSTMIAGTDGDGIFLSSDSGLNWEPINNGLTNLNIKAVLISGANFLLGNAFMGGLYISTDNGANWNMVNNGLGIPTSVIQYFGNTGTNLVVNAIGSGIYVSTDNGLNWSASTLINSSTNYFYGFATDGPNTYVGSSGDGVLLSTDNGLSFTKQFSGTNFSIRNLAFNGSDIYGTNQSGYGLYLSNDNCNSFTIHNTGISNYLFKSIKKCGQYIFTGNVTGQGVWRLPITNPVGIGNNLNTNKTKIYPIPSKEYITIEFEDKYNNHNMTLYNISGQEILERKLTIDNVTINIKDLEKGVYFVKIYNDESQEYKKILIE